MEVVGVEQIKPGISSRCEEILRDLWQKNGDQCSGKFSIHLSLSC